MKKKTLIYIFIAIIAIFTIFTLIHLTKPFVNKNKQDEFYEKASEPVLGIYDRHEKMSSEKAVSLKHFTIRWNNVQEESPVEKQLLNTLKEKQNVLLTIEMWSGRGEAYSPHGILQGMVNGDYDKKVIKLCTDLSAVANSSIYLRWNPEMELPVNKYQWQSQSYYLYTKAFRHFAELCKKFAPQAKIVWGPSGYAGSLEYWPGSDIVDFASITLNNLPPALSSKYPAERSIPVQIKRKLHRLRFIDKPVFILGSEKIKKDTFNNQWIDAAIADIRKDTAIIYSQKNFTRSGKINIYPENSKLQLGVYDPSQQLVNEPAITVEHIFSDWGNIQEGSFKKRFDEVIARHHDVIVTVEPWKSKTHPNDKDVLNNTLNGTYDDVIRELYNIISNVKQTVYLRWAHEMEIPVERYAWQNQDPVTYIQAYRYVMQFNKNKAKNIRNVWGPTGDRGALDWYPGDDVVDYISVAIYGLPNKDITDHNRQEAFSTIFKRKFNRMRFVNKPIFITEFGVKGPQSYKKNWLDDAAATINGTREIDGACYFNFSDVPKAWGKIEPPDWSITKETFLHLTSQLKQLKQR